jgi:hypothetical protein
MPIAYRGGSRSDLVVVSIVITAASGHLGRLTVLAVLDRGAHTIEVAPTTTAVVQGYVA